jgi:hypothetical protein
MKHILLKLGIWAGAMAAPSLFAQGLTNDRLVAPLLLSTNQIGYVKTPIPRQFISINLTNTGLATNAFGRTNGVGTIISSVTNRLDAGEPTKPSAAVHVVGEAPTVGLAPSLGTAPGVGNAPSLGTPPKIR